MSAKRKKTSPSHSSDEQDIYDTPLTTRPRVVHGGDTDPAKKTVRFKKQLTASAQLSLTPLSQPVQRGECATTVEDNSNQQNDEKKPTDDAVRRLLNTPSASANNAQQLANNAFEQNAQLQDLFDDDASSTSSQIIRNRSPDVFPTPQVETTAFVALKFVFGKLASMTTRYQRRDAAIKLLPHLFSVYNTLGDSDTCKYFGVTDQQITENIMYEFHDPFVWRNAWRKVFGKFAKFINLDMLPDFYIQNDTEAMQYNDWHAGNRSSGYEPVVGTWQQWRNYYTLCSYLFAMLLRTTVIATKSFKCGSWHEFFQCNDTSASLQILDATSGVFMLPPTAGIIGDPHTFALSAFDPIRARKSLAEKHIARWYTIDPRTNPKLPFSHPVNTIVDDDEDTKVKQSISIAGVQFARLKTVLQVGKQAQWWDYDQGLDAFAIDQPDSTELEAELLSISNTLATLRAQIDAGADLQRRVPELKAYIEDVNNDLASAADPTRNSGMFFTVEELKRQKSNSEKELARLLETKDVVERRAAKAENEIDAFTTEYMQLVEFQKMREKSVFHLQQYQIADTASTMTSSAQSLLEAANFTMLDIDAPKYASDVDAGSNFGLALTDNETEQLRAILFNDRAHQMFGQSNSVDLTGIAAEMRLQSDDAQKAQSSTANAPTLKPAYMPPQHVGQLVVFQSKITVSLLHTLRYYTGSVAKLFKDRYGNEHGVHFQYASRVNYQAFRESAVFRSLGAPTRDADAIASFILWIAAQNQRDTTLKSYNSLVPIGALPMSLNDTNNDDDDIKEDYNFSRNQSDDDDNIPLGPYASGDWLGKVVNKSVFPFLRAYTLMNDDTNEWDYKDESDDDDEGSKSV